MWLKQKLNEKLHTYFESCTIILFQPIRETYCRMLWVITGSSYIKDHTLRGICSLVVSRDMSWGNIKNNNCNLGYICDTYKAYGTFLRIVLIKFNRHQRNKLYLCIWLISCYCALYNIIHNIHFTFFYYHHF